MRELIAGSIQHPVVVADFLDPLVSELGHFGAERLDGRPITIKGAVETTSATITSDKPRPAALAFLPPLLVRECDKDWRSSQGHVADGSKLMMRDSGCSGIRGLR